MFHPVNIGIRPAAQGDAICLGVLATQVFLDTYATNGINSDLAIESLQNYSPAVFEARLRNPQIEVTVAEHDGNLVGFVDVEIDSTCPVTEFSGPEVLRLYVQVPFQRHGVGQALLKRAEARAESIGAQSIWLTAWVGNAGALAFYPRVGYKDVGITQYAINGKNYENRVFVKTLASAA
jgi:ribosomal protein S18 acetylase RimI-like enzyme